MSFVRDHAMTLEIIEIESQSVDPLFVDPLTIRRSRML